MENLDLKLQDFPVTAKDIQRVLGYQYKSAHRVYKGDRTLQPGALNYLLLKLDLHPTEKLITK